MRKGYSEIIQKLAWDCKIWNLSERESLTYFEQMGHPISRMKYYRILKFLESSRSIHVWMDQQAKTGFIINHREHFEEIERIKEPIMRMFILQTNLPDYVSDPTDNNPNLKQRRRILNPQKKPYLILRLAERLESLNRRAAEINLGNPVVANIKTKIDQLEKQASQSNRDDGHSITFGIFDN